MESMKAYTAVRYGRTRAEVEREIQERWKAGKGSGVGAEKESFLESWKKKREAMSGDVTAANLPKVKADEILEPKKVENEDETVFRVRK